MIWDFEFFRLVKFWIMFLFIYLFFLGMFNDPFHSRDSVELSGKVLVNSELERIWKNVVMDLFQVISW